MLNSVLISTITLFGEVSLVALALYGIGRLSCGLLPSTIGTLPAHWLVPFTAVVGVGVFDACVELLLFSGLGSRSGLRWAGAGLACIGVVTSGFVLWFRRRELSDLVASVGHFVRGMCGIDRSLLLSVVAAVTVNMIIAAAPSTKMDELSYHMLIAKRVITDGSIVPYILPYEASALPQMHFQIALSVCQAWGLADLGNLISLFLGVLLLWFLFGVAREYCTVGLSLVCAGVACFGLYAAVAYTASGPHALGDVASTLGFVAAVMLPFLIEKIGPVGFMVLVSTAMSIAASTKISLWPVCAVTVAICCVQLLFLPGAARVRLSLAVAALGPWFFVHVPMLGYTWVKTGAPFGPLFFGSHFGSHPPSEAVKAIQLAKVINQVNISSALADTMMHFSPLILICPVLLFFIRSNGRDRRYILGGLIIFQGLLVWLYLPHFARFLSGLLFASVLAVVIGIQHSTKSQFIERQRGWIALLLLGPWFCMQIYYSWPFFTVFSGFTGKEAFLGKYVAFAQDYKALDRILPKDSILLTDGRIPAFYAPRPVIFTTSDYRTNAPIYLLTTDAGVKKMRYQMPNRSTIECGSVVYQNLNANLLTFRNPLRSPVTGPVSVRTCVADTATKALSNIRSPADGGPTGSY